MEQYSHRNQETGVPEIAGWYWIKTNFVRAKSHMHLVYIDADNPALIAFLKEKKNYLYWGPVEPPIYVEEKGEGNEENTANHALTRKPDHSES